MDIIFEAIILIIGVIIGLVIAYIALVAIFVVYFEVFIFPFLLAFNSIMELIAGERWSETILLKTEEPKNFLSFIIFFPLLLIYGLLSILESKDKDGFHLITDIKNRYKEKKSILEKIGNVFGPLLLAGIITILTVLLLDPIIPYISVFILAVNGVLAGILLIAKIIEVINTNIRNYQDSKQKLEKSKTLVFQASLLENQDLGDPFNTQILENALTLYNQAYELVQTKEYYLKLRDCEDKIYERETFQHLLKKAEDFNNKYEFEQALENFEAAKKIFLIESVDESIKTCLEKIELSKLFDTVLKDSRKLAQNGQFSVALTQFKRIYEKFKHPKGQQFIDKLSRIITGKTYWKQGLYCEGNNDNNKAISFYKKALEYLPEMKEGYERLGILYFKENNFDQGINYLQKIETETAKYYLGLIYFKQGDLQTAQKEWNNINNLKVQQQKETLKIIAQRQRLFLKKNIQDFVIQDKLDNAAQTSLKFIEKFGNDPLVSENFHSHIQPLLFTQNWQNQNWQKILTETEKIWLENKDIASLHNYAIALFYHSQIDSNHLDKLIVIWSTCLANLNLNPALKNIPWLGMNTFNLEDISGKLKQLIERQIDEYKETNLDKYFELRDIYRQEMLALKLIKDYQNSGIKDNNLYITPGCYEIYQNKLGYLMFNNNILGGLYTKWGKTIAACIDNDLKRAISIKPNIKPLSQDEKFAYSLVSYYEGSYYLQQYDWRKAKTILTEIKQELKNNSEWWQNIDKLCQKQCQEINQFNTHLEFSNFWYQLLESQTAKTYYVDYKSRDIATKLANEKISIDTGLSELRKLKQIESNNPIVMDLIKKVELIKESQNIDRHLQNGNLSEAVRQAKLSNNQEIRYRVALICIEILLKGAEKRQFYPEQMVELGRWAFQLCPYEPAFQPIYQSLNIYY